MNNLSQENIENEEVDSVYLQGYKYSVGDIFTYGVLTKSILNHGGNYLEFGGRESLPYFLLVREDGNEHELYKLSLEFVVKSSFIYQHIVKISQCEIVPLSAYSLDDYSPMPKASLYLFKLNELDIIDNYVHDTFQYKCVLIAKILERSLNKECDKIYFSKFPRHKYYLSLLFDFVDFYIVVDRYFLSNLRVEELFENVFGLKNKINNRFVTGNFFYEKVHHPIPEHDLPFMEKKEGVWRF